MALILKDASTLLLNPSGQLTEDPNCCCGTGTGTAGTGLPSTHNCRNCNGSSDGLPNSITVMIGGVINKSPVANCNLFDPYPCTDCGLINGTYVCDFKGPPDSFDSCYFKYPGPGVLVCPPSIFCGMGTFNVVIDRTVPPNVRAIFHCITSTAISIVMSKDFVRDTCRGSYLLTYADATSVGSTNCDQTNISVNILV